MPGAPAAPGCCLFDSPLFAVCNRKSCTSDCFCFYTSISEAFLEGFFFAYLGPENNSLQRLPVQIGGV